MVFEGPSHRGPGIVSREASSRIPTKGEKARGAGERIQKSPVLDGSIWSPGGGRDIDILCNLGHGALVDPAGASADHLGSDRTPELWQCYGTSDRGRGRPQ